jgi:non-haem dioxygenase in morphine synthesis N-terminal
MPSEMPAPKYETGADKRLNETLIQNLTPSFTEIPVIDISRSVSPNIQDRIALAKDIRKVCETVGFFYISNHGIPFLRGVLIDRG